MAYLWSFTIDLAVFLVLYKHRLAWFFMHVIIGLGVSFLTLLLAIPILLQLGIPQQENNDFSQRHAIIGAIIITVILAQVLMGFASNIMKQIRWSSPMALLIMNTGHKYTGYGLLILAKIQVFLIMKT